MKLSAVRQQKTHETPRHSRQSSSAGRDFKTIMAETTRSMPRYRRVFSSVIHIKAVSLASELLGRTIARPNAILFGSILSFAITIVFYLLSKNLGYSLSGSESAGAFLIGWTAGIIFDLVAPLFKRK